MGGEVEFESSPGVGSVFWFTARMGRSPAVNNDARAVVLVQLAGRRVLIVGQCAATRSILTRQLADLGLESDSVSGTRETLAALSSAQDKSRPFEVVIFDGLVSNDDGRDLAPWIRAESGDSNLKILILS